MQYVNLVIDNKSRHTDRFYTYGINEDVPLGTKVYVSFARGKAPRGAYVVEKSVEPDFDIDKIKVVEDIETSWRLSQEAIETALWMKKRYGIRYIDAINLFVPKNKKKAIREKVQMEQNKQFQDSNNLSINKDKTKKEKMLPILLHHGNLKDKNSNYESFVEKTLEEGKNIIFLVPEIAGIHGAYQWLSNFVKKEEIAVLHSNLTVKKRDRQWMKIFNKSAKVVIGTRIAAFAPISNLGLIIMDEEQELTYKADMTPKYETLDIVYKRALALGATLVLGSLTPSVIAYYRAKTGIYHLVEKGDYRKNNLEIVSMEKELRQGNSGIFSEALYEKLKEGLEKDKQGILITGRRGYSTYVECNNCGNGFLCPNCNLPLVYHKKIGKGVCHYCGKKFELWEQCPECGSENIRFHGFGGEKIEEYTRELFPDKIVRRIDGDTINNSGNKREIEEIIEKFNEGQIHILIVMPMVPKFLDNSKVGTLGIVSTDESLNLPDYRSSEKTYQLIESSLKSVEDCNVIIQTKFPETYPIPEASKENYLMFFEKEIGYREVLNNPPFRDIIQVSIRGNNKNYTLKEIKGCLNYLKNQKVLEPSMILEPKEDMYYSTKDSFRYSFLMKVPKEFRNNVVYLSEKYGEELIKREKNMNLVIDVNPY